MRVFYYSLSYCSQGGDGIHSREFVRAFRQLPGVETVEVFPNRPVSCKTSRPKMAVTLKNVLQSLKKFLRKLLPGLCEGFIMMFILPFAQYPALKKALRRANVDTAIMRDNVNFLLIRKIKRDFPAMTLCVEVNATAFDEFWAGLCFEKFWRRLEAKQLALADCITVVSTHLKDYFCQLGIPAEKILVNHNGVNPSIFSPERACSREKIRNRLNIPHEAFVLGYVGGVDPFRRLTDVVKKIAEIRSAGQRDIFLLLICDKTTLSQKILRNIAMSDGWILCTGRISYEEIPDIMQVFDLAIFPFSNPYGSPIKLFEYLAMGIPTIGPDTPAVREIFENNKHLRLVSQDGSDFMEAVKELKNSPLTRNKLARAGQQHVLEFYTWQANARRVYEHLNKFRRRVH